MDHRLVLHTPGTPARLLFGDVVKPHGDDDFLLIKMTLADEGMTAEADVRLSIADEPTLSSFLTELADAWQGWAGVKVWRAARRQLELDARHDGHAQVILGVTIRSWRATHTDDGWSARTVFAIEAGEQMRRFAEGVTALLGW